MYSTSKFLRLTRIILLHIVYFTPNRAMSFIGLALIGLGTGGIKPCVSAFGGEQFKLPEQSAQVTKFFSIFYAAINGGSLISTLLTPILHKEVKCFGQDSCFPLSFGIPCALMIVAVCKYSIFIHL